VSPKLKASGSKLAITTRAETIYDVPLHPLLRNVIGRQNMFLLALVFFRGLSRGRSLFGKFGRRIALILLLSGGTFDLMTVAMYFMSKVHPVQKDPSSRSIKTSDGLTDLPEDFRGMALKLVDLQANGQHFDPSDLYTLFDMLPVVRSAEMVGKHYRGVIVHHGGLLSLVDATVVRLLALLAPSWASFQWGKHYTGHYVGHPLVLRVGNICIPVPIWGNVCNLDLSHRGCDAVATMVYDSHPWKDYFVKLGMRDGKNVLLGVWETHGALGGFFTLTEE